MEHTECVEHRFPHFLETHDNTPPIVQECQTLATPQPDGAIINV